MFYRLYVDAEDRADNAFAQYGSLFHSLLDRYFRGDIDLFALTDSFEKEFDKSVKEKFPYGDKLREKYYASGISYFSEFDGVPDGFSVICSEKKFTMNCRGYDFTGVIDLVLKDDSGYHIVDHKSRSDFKSDAEKHEYFRQLYLYSAYIYRVMGEYPKTLSFNMFRTGKMITIPFNVDDYKEAFDWMMQTIEKIYRDTEFLAVKDTYFCQNICSARNSCMEDTDEH